MAADAAKTNFGSATELRAGALPDVRTYLRFGVQGLDATVERAVLWLWLKSSSTAGYDVRGVSRNNWSESSITYKGAPSVGAVIANSGPVTFSSWTAVDVTPLVAGNGTVSMALTSASPTALTFASREAGAATAPHLEVTLRDTTAPVVTLTSPAPGSAISDTTPSFAGGAGLASGDLASVTVKVYAGSSATGSPVQTLATQRALDGSYSVAAAPVAQGPFTAQAEQADAAGNVGRSAAVGFTVDTAAPVTTIASGPADPSGATGATFTFSASESATFDCRLDAAAYAPCTSPKAYSGLADGVHAFTVRATDAAGNVGAPATASWRVDTAAPVATITASPPDTAPTGSASLAFEASEPASFECRLDSAAFAACTSPRGYSGLADGLHTFAVRAIDAAGNTGSPASAAWRVDTTAPVVTLARPPEGSTTNDTTPAFSGTAGTGAGDDATVTLQVREGNATGPLAASLSAAVAPDGSFTVSPADALADGVYSARAQQGDSLGHVGTSAANSFTIDHSAVDVDPPTVTLTAPAPGSSINTPTPTLAGTAGTADGDLATVTVRLYAGAQPSGTALQTLTAQRQANGSFSVTASPLAGGVYTVRAEQQDSFGNTGLSAASTFTVDTVAPTVTLTEPVNGTATYERKPVFRGVAGTATGDAATVSVKVFAGTIVTGTPVLVVAAPRQAGGAYAGQPATPLPEGTYTARAEQADAAGNTGTSVANTFTVRDPVLVGAGDIASCEGGDGDTATAALLDSRPNAIVYTLGDNAYTDGTVQQFANCYDPTWGRAKARTRPAVAGHDYGDGSNAGAGYYGYFQNQLAPFGTSATDPTRGYYSYDVGSWHVTVLNAFCYTQSTCDELAMERWFSADLAAHPADCTVAMWHNSRFSSGAVHGNQTNMQTLWSIAYEAGVDVVLSGHEHTYERFAPQNDAGALDLDEGVRQFVVGSGGYFHYALGTRRPNSEVFNNDTFGVLELTLHPGSYDWRFLPEAGRVFTDSGSTTCHGAPVEPPPPPGAPQLLGTSSAALNGPATQLSIARPAQTVPGSLLVAVVAHQGGSAKTMAPPAGWTAVPATDWFEGTNARIHAWYRMATASEPASYTFTQSGTSGYDMAGGIMAIEDADPQAPIDASGGQSNGSTGSKLVTAPSITTDAAGGLLVFGGACNIAASFLPPTGMTEMWDVTSSGQYKVSLGTAWQHLAASGATGSRAATASSSCRSVAVQMAIAPDSP